MVRQIHTWHTPAITVTEQNSQRPNLPIVTATEILNLAFAYFGPTVLQRMGEPCPCHAHPYSESSPGNPQRNPTPSAQDTPVSSRTSARLCLSIHPTVILFSKALAQRSFSQRFYHFPFLPNLRPPEALGTVQPLVQTLYPISYL